MIRDANNSESDGRPTGGSQDDFGLVRDVWGRLKMIDRDGRSHQTVTAVPLFPMSHPNQWISICDADGDELACVVDPAKLAPTSRNILLEELSRREFLPVIERIVRVSGNSEPCEWDVETDRGPTKFVLDNEDKVRRLGANKVAITDANGIRYLVDDVQELDRKSRRVIEWYV